jgi:hypothetical protein
MDPRAQVAGLEMIADKHRTKRCGSSASAAVAASDIDFSIHEGELAGGLSGCCRAVAQHAGDVVR